jgi:hypothetical protein
MTVWGTPAFSAYGDRLAFLHNDGEQQVDVLKWHGGPQCPEGLHKAPQQGEWSLLILVVGAL